jgi:hypothetical protein
MLPVIDTPALGALLKLNEAIASGATLAEVTGLYADYILERRGGNKVHASLTLNVNRRTLQRWNHRPVTRVRCAP